MELTDGWYAVSCNCDAEMNKLIVKKKVSVGTKLLIANAELLGAAEGYDPLEVSSYIDFQGYSPTADGCALFSATRRGTIENIDEFGSAGAVERDFGILFRSQYSSERVEKRFAKWWRRRAADGHGGAHLSVFVRGEEAGW